MSFSALHCATVYAVISRIDPTKIAFCHCHVTDILLRSWFQLVTAVIVVVAKLGGWDKMVIPLDITTVLFPSSLLCLIMLD